MFLFGEEDFMGKVMKKSLSIMLALGMILVLIPNLGKVKEVEAASSRAQVVDILKSQVGYYGKASNAFLDDPNANKSGKYTKYHRDIGYTQNCDWCTIFVTWVLWTAGIPSSEIPKGGYVRDWTNWGSSRGIYHAFGTYNPKPGDLVIYDDTTVSGLNDHIGFFISGGGNEITTIEGNTSSNGYKSTVAYKTRYSQSRSPSFYIQGYIDMSGYYAPDDHHPEGYLDSVEVLAPGTIKVKGWSYDPDNSSASNSVHIYIGGVPGDANAESYAIGADKERADVNNVMGVSGRHGFEEIIHTKKSGNQVINAYGIDITTDNNAGLLAQSGTIVNILADTEKPVVSNVQVSNITADGYDVTCKVSDNGGIKKVEFPTWTKENGQDDLKWHLGTVSNGVATYHVKRSDHNNEFGVYCTDVYAFDYADNISVGVGADRVTLDPINESKGTLNGHEYIVCKDGITATEARAKEGNGYHLATITSQEEHDFIMSLTKKISVDPGAYWLGANDNKYEGHFQWETGEPFDFNLFPAGQPDNTDGTNGEAENYFGVWSSGIWNDFAERTRLGYVLEKDPPVSTASGTFNEHEYYVSAEYLTRAEAEALQTDGWYLATITSSEEKDYLVGLISGLNEKNLNGYWLGGNDVATEGTFVWENGEKFSYSNWGAYQPSNNNRFGQNENYLSIWDNGEFNDSNEYYCLGYILEKNPEPAVIEMESIEITSDRDTSRNVYEGDSFKLTATVSPSNATNQSVVWSSSNEEYATVDEEGNVEVKSTGIKNRVYVDIQAASETDNVKNTYRFNVYPKSGYCNSTKTVMYDIDYETGVVRIYGEGAMAAEKMFWPWAENDDLNKIVIEDGVTSTDAMLCFNSNIREVTFADSVEFIKDFEFDNNYNVSYITSLVLPAKLKTIYNNTFSTYAGSLQDIYFKSNAPSVFNNGEIEVDKNATLHVPSDAIGFENWPGTILYDQPAIGNECNHTWDAGEVTKTATCKEEGEITFTCTKCGETKTETIAKAEHTPVTDAAVEPTCETTGKTAGSHCSVCGKVLKSQDPISALGHDYGEYISNNDATCVKDGTATAKCSRCEATKTITITGSATGVHDWGEYEVTTEPTCTSVGIKTRYCKNCNKKETLGISVLEHEYVEEIQENSTCTKMGIKKLTCSKCGDEKYETIDLKDHTVVTDPAVAPTKTSTGLTEGSHCTVCGKVIKAQKTVPMLEDDEDGCSKNGHKWNAGVVIKQPTCTDKGIKECACTVCGEKKTEEIAAKGHTVVKDPAVDATTEKTGLSEGSHCSVCGITIKRQEVIPKKEDTNKKSEEPATTNYSNEWINGKWYDANGKQTYSGTMSWKSNGTGKWIEDSAGWYPADSWQKIDGVWYYFKPDGYAAADEYYNGYWFNKDGSWDPQYKLSWKSNATGWWVEDISGWWPQSSWLKIDGCWYYFDSSGYMVTSRYIDGWWIGADGVCR